MRASGICFAWLCFFAFNQDPRFLFLSSVFFLYLFWGFNLATKTLVSFLFSKLPICQHELRLCSGPGLGTDPVWHLRLMDREEGPRPVRQELKAKDGGPCDLQSQSLRHSLDLTHWKDQPDLEGRQSCWRRKRMWAEPQASRTPKRQKHQESEAPQWPWVPKRSWGGTPAYSQFPESSTGKRMWFEALPAWAITGDPTWCRTIVFKLCLPINSYEESATCFCNSPEMSFRTGVPNLWATDRYPPSDQRWL